MSMRRILSISLVVSLLVTALVTPTWAGPAAPTVQLGIRADPAAPNAGLRASIDRAATEALASPRLGGRSTGARATVDQQSSGGGGGGGGWIIWTLLGTAASVGMGYYIMRQMRKQTNPTPAAAR